MVKTFLICSLVGRIDGVISLITSLSRYSDEWQLVIVLQKYPVTDIAIIEMHLKSVWRNEFEILSTNDATGPHMARCLALDKMHSDIWCILDDDMLAIDKTDYDSMADIVSENRNIGLLSGNWRKTEKMAIAVEPADKIIYQPIVYTGGGMIFRDDIAEIIQGIPRTMYVFDNPLWSIYAFVNGYDNCRYMGSIAIHRICTKGGRIKWLKENEGVKHLPPSEWIKTRKGSGGKGSNNEYLICDSSDITDIAKKLHKENKK